MRKLSVSDTGWTSVYNRLEAKRMFRVLHPQASWQSSTVKARHVVLPMKSVESIEYNPLHRSAVA